jgi:hypothetical protein
MTETTRFITTSVAFIISFPLFAANSFEDADNELLDAQVGVRQCKLTCEERHPCPEVNKCITEDGQTFNVPFKACIERQRNCITTYCL